MDAFQSFCLGRGLKLISRFVERFVGERKCTPVHAEHVRRAAVLSDLNGLLRIGVLCLHEPSRRVGADRENRDQRRAKPFADLFKNCSVAISSVSRAIDQARRRFQNISSPKRHPPIPKSARGPVIRGHYRHADIFRDGKHCPPIPGLHFNLRRVRVDYCVVPMRSENPRAMDFPKPSHSVGVKVVVVIMGYEQRIDRRQILKSNGGWIVAVRPGPLDRARARGPHWINQDIAATCLNEIGSVADVRDLQVLDSLCGAHAHPSGDHLRPGNCLAKELPFEDFQQALVRGRQTRMKKPDAIEMVGDRPLIIAISQTFSPFY